MAFIGALIGFATAWNQRKYDFVEVLKNGAIWGAIVGFVFVIFGSVGGIDWLQQFFGNIELSGLTGTVELFFGPFLYALVETILGSFAVPIYRWLKNIRV